MPEANPRYWPVFFEVYEALPRQGPGNRACVERALALCRDLPAAPRIVDLGCGSGGQSLDIAALTAGDVVAIDSHAPFIERMQAEVAARRLGERVHPVAGDMAEPPVEAASLDLVWSEGALYFLGLPRALVLCRDLLRPGGYVAFSEPVWRSDNPPAEVRASFADYPGMGTVADALAAIEHAGFDAVGHFTVPDEAWWEDFYTPMQRRIEELRAAVADDADTLAVLDEIAREPEMHRHLGASYAYEFFIARKKA